MPIKKIWSLFVVGVFQSEAHQNYFIAVINGEDGRFVPRYVAFITILTQTTTITVSKSTFQLSFQGQGLFNLYIPMQTDQIHIRMQTTRVSRVHVQVASRLIKFKTAKLRIQEQTRADKETSGKAMVFISVWLTLVVNKYFAVSQCNHAWQILSRFLEGPNKFCQSSASGPCLYLPNGWNIRWRTNTFVQQSPSTWKWLRRAVEGKVLHDFVNRLFLIPSCCGKSRIPLLPYCTDQQSLPWQTQAMVYRAGKIRQGNF